MNRHAWWLADGEEMHRRAPRSFFVPPRHHREALEPGRLVKLVFEFAPRELQGVPRTGERMWVAVTEARADGTYVGSLDNTPGLLTELRPGDLVEFRAEHVVALQYSPDELGYDPHAFASVDARILHEDLPPDVVMKAPTGADDQRMWFAMVGTTPPKDTLPLSLGDLTDRWSGLAEVFSSNGGGWERIAGEMAWHQMAAPEEFDDSPRAP